jgi:hypothetical protein
MYGPRFATMMLQHGPKGKRGEMNIEMKKCAGSDLPSTDGF